MDMSAAAAPFGSRFIWLFLGGFVLAIALERHHLHRRFALKLLHALGGGPRRTLMGFMLATALLSMWISNTATTLMMLPMAVAVLGLLEEQGDAAQWGNALILGIAYSANVGGMATLVGTPPNAALAGVAADRFGVDIGFGEWMAVGLPISMILLLAVFLMLARRYAVPAQEGTGGGEVIQRELLALPAMASAEKRVLVLFAATAALWMFRVPLNALLAETGVALNDTSIAVAAAIACFAWRDGEKGQPLLAAEDLKRLPWDILLLFGGGLALAKGFEAAGWAASIAEGATGWGWPIAGMMVAVTVMGLFATELMSNLALTLLLTPVVGAMALGMEVHPMHFAVPVTLASSCAFMLPMATPPNAIVFSSGRISMAEMARTGLLLNAVACALVLLLWWCLAPAVWW
jgi:sodium-dependent dicarboxylate transporter 2/3/5